jgi:thiosulfate reductase cytochrome b subunit
MATFHTLATAAAIVMWLLSTSAIAQPVAVEFCSSCHDKENFDIEGSIHEDLSCTDCHGDPKAFEEVPHNKGERLIIVCANCHDAVAEEYKTSVHGRLQMGEEADTATCSDCHGTHNILPSTDRNSTVNKFNLSNTCSKCHKAGPMMEMYKVGELEAVEHYIDSIHGHALLTDGLAVAPSCNDCHGVHDILPNESKRSRISKDNVPETCGQCHVLVEEIYDKSVHGKLLAAGDERGPTCVTCHTSHEISTPDEPEFRLSIDKKCGQCHQDRVERYRETFHGKAIALGRTGVAACFDCHGHHDILPASDPNSRIIAGPRRLQTCRQCHPDANENFTEYIVHADHLDKENYPQIYWTFVFMTVLLLGTFSFFALHTLFWLVRSTYLYRHDSKTFRKAKIHARKDEEVYVRFRPIDRFIHGLVIFSFLLLVLTGMPLKFYYTGWAQWLLDIMGGQAVAALLHRVGAIITIFYFLVHILTVLISLWQKRYIFKDPSKGRVTFRQFMAVATGPDSPMPNMQDVRDFIAHQKWFLGRGEKPQFDRWTYWEKFDYLAVFWGVAFIGLSGLIMWYPEVFTSFLPGWTINVALLVHSDEALLAAGFIFTFHFFNVHFRLEKFPMDHSIFSGRISRSELLQERRKLFERWQKEKGGLEAHKVKDEWPSWQKITLPAGAIAFIIGLAIAILIYVAMYDRLVNM